MLLQEGRLEEDFGGVESTPASGRSRPLSKGNLADSTPLRLRVLPPMRKCLSRIGGPAHPTQPLRKHLERLVIARAQDKIAEDQFGTQRNLVVQTTVHRTKGI